MPRLNYFSQLFILLFLWFGFQNYTQANEIDSLNRLLETSQGESKVDVYNQLIWIQKSSQPDMAIQNGLECLKLAKAIEYDPGIAKTHYYLSILFYYKENHKESILNANEAIRYYESREDLVAIAKCWNIIGLNEIILGNYNSALLNFNQALGQFKLIHNEEYVLKLQANIGNVYYRLGALDTALQAYSEIVDYARQTNNEEVLNTNLQNVALIHWEFGNYVKSLEISYEVLNKLRENQDSSLMPNTIQSIASAFNRLELYDEAKEFIQESIAIDKKLNRRLHLASSYITLGVALKALGELDSALHYNLLAKSLYEELGNKSTSAVLVSIGSILFDKGQFIEAETYFRKSLTISQYNRREAIVAKSKYHLGRLLLRKNELDSAENNLLDAFTYWQESKMYDELASVTNELSKFYSNKGEHEKAYEFQGLNAMANDSLFDRAKQNKLMSLMVKQSLLEKEKEYTKLESTLTTSKQGNNWFWIALIILITTIGLVYYTIRKGNRIKELKSDLNKQGRELAFLSLSAMQKDKFITEFTDKLEPIINQDPENQELKALLINLKTQELQTNSWNKFKSVFEQIAPQFFDNLLSKFSSLTETDLRFCALIRLGLPTKEIARIFGISAASVNKARYRLRRRFEIGKEENLDRFILSI